MSREITVPDDQTGNTAGRRRERSPAGKFKVYVNQDLFNEEIVAAQAVQSMVQSVGRLRKDTKRR